MIKKYLILLFLSLLSSSFIYSKGNVSEKDGLGKTGGYDKLFLKGKNSNFKKGIDALNQAIKYNEKGKADKAKKRFNDTIKYCLLAYEDFPNNTTIITYLAFSYEKIGDYVMAEIYYTQGLEVDPKHIEINEYLGELYVKTNRIDKAKERLKVLENCSCVEYKNLKNIIRQENSKY